MKKLLTVLILMFVLGSMAYAGGGMKPHQGHDPRPAPIEGFGAQ